MAIALGVSAKQAASAATSMTTASVTTQASGSTFVITVCDPNQSITVSDSKSNSYTQIGTTLTVGNTKMSMWRCENGTGGTGHTATVTWTSGTADGTITFAEITGAETASFDVTAQAFDDSSPYTVTSPTLSQANELAICFVGTDNAPISYAESTGFTIYQQETNSGLYWTSAALYKIVSSTSALTPSFSGIGSGFNVGVFVATFKEATGASPPAITVQPEGASAAVGGTANYSITETGATSYQWQVSTNGGETWANVSGGSGATTASYTTPTAVSTDNGKQYRCQATNANGTTNSVGAWFFVRDLAIAGKGRRAYVSAWLRHESNNRGPLRGRGPRILRGLFDNFNDTRTDLTAAWRDWFGLSAPAASSTTTTSLGAAVQAAQSATASVDAAIQAAAQASASLDAFIQAGGVVTASLGAAVQAGQAATAGLGAAVQQSNTAGASFDTVISIAAVDRQQDFGSRRNRPGRGPYSLGRYFRPAVESRGVAAQARTASASLGAVVQAAQAATASLDAALQVARSSSASLDTFVQAGSTASASLGAAIQAGQSSAASLGAAVQAALSSTASLSVAVQAAAAATATLSTSIQAAQSAQAQLAAAVQATQTAGTGLNAYVQAGTVATVSLTAAVQQAQAATASLSAAVATAGSSSASMSAAVAQQLSAQASLNAAVREARIASASISMVVFDPNALTFSADSRQRIGEASQTVMPGRIGPSRGAGGGRIGGGRL